TLTFEQCESRSYRGSDGHSLPCAQGPKRFTGAFDNTGYVQVSDASKYDFTTAMSVSAWVRPMKALSGTLPILSKWTSSSQAYRLYVSGTHYTFAVKTEAGTYSVS